MKIVILGSYTANPGDLSWDEFIALGEVAVYERATTEGPEALEKETIDRIGNAEIVCTNGVHITRAVIDACPNIKLIAAMSTGYEKIDCQYAREKGIPVCNVPTYGTASVSQFAVALLLEICHHIGHHSSTVHNGKWQNSPDWCYWDYPLIELDGKTFGLIGCGRIGYHTAKTLRALGMRVLTYDLYPTDAGREVAEYVDLDTLLAASDVIGIHMPLLPISEGIINKANIAKMKDGVIIINNSRGQIVVEQDLADALNSGKVAAAGLDVVSTEPIKADNPLLTAKNCIITPHISWASRESRGRILECTVKNIQGYLSGELINVVN